MKRLHKYDGIDLFRMVAAFLAVAAHTYPLSSVSTDLNYMLVHIIARIAVPFFMMTTGYFVFQACRGCQGDGSPDNKRRIYSENSTFYVRRTVPLTTIKKTGLIYVGATLLYLPVSIYAGYYSEGNFFITFIQNLVLDGTFYHLWYLPAVIIGLLIVYALLLKCSFRLTLGITVVLYLLGMVGDNYYTLTASIPVLNTAYEAGFHIFSYTRNGLFYAPVFLTMGALIAKQKQPFTKRTNIIGFITFMLLMMAEGMVLKHFDIPRHTSMYLMLLPCAFFLFGLLRSHEGKRSLFMRDTSMWIYILHPLVIVAVRGAARMVGHTESLVENSITFFLIVSCFSLVCAILIGKREKISAVFTTTVRGFLKPNELY